MYKFVQKNVKTGERKVAVKQILLLTINQLTQIKVFYIFLKFLTIAD